MKPKWSRRDFSLAAVLVGASSILPVVSIGRTTDESVNTPYIVRWRYFCQMDFVYWWIRVVKRAAPTADVLLQQQFALDKGFSQVIGVNTYLAKASESHIVRGIFVLSSGIHAGKLAVYTRLLVDGTTQIGRVIRIKHR